MIFARDHGSVPRKPQVPYLAVADALRERLAAHYGVSRTTAARAVRVLADEGRVTVVRNWGAFVAER
jgi:DNA-binding GntR family transcriptional regulator